MARARSCARACAPRDFFPRAMPVPTLPRHRCARREAEDETSRERCQRHEPLVIPRCLARAVLSRRHRVFVSAPPICTGMLKDITPAFPRATGPHLTSPSLRAMRDKI
jgi:hypothetical protein